MLIPTIGFIFGLVLGLIQVLKFKVWFGSRNALWWAFVVGLGIPMFMIGVSGLVAHSRPEQLERMIIVGLAFLFDGGFLVGWGIPTLVWILQRVRVSIH